MKPFNPSTNTKWCPMVRIQVIKEEIVSNRPNNLTKTTCIGKHCAVWISDCTWEDGTGYCGLIRRT